MRPFTPADLPVYDRWRAEIRAERFMSKFFPDYFNGRATQITGRGMWWLIMVDGSGAGVIWLERDRGRDSEARLGIMIGVPELWGRGIGRRAVSLALVEAAREPAVERIRLNVRQANTRAIACYRASGFEITARGRKVNSRGEDIDYYTMERRTGR